MKPIEPDDYDELLNTIYYLKEVRDRQFQIDNMWEPIKVKYFYSQLMIIFIIFMNIINRYSNSRYLTILTVYGLKYFSIYLLQRFQATIDLLKQYDVIFGEETYTWLKDLPEQWASVKKWAAQVKQIVSPLMARQIDLLKKRFSYYDFKQQEYLERFYENIVFK